jgi:thiamine-phosphate pyrophosphorylase
MESIARNLQEGIEWIQIREKDLEARALYELTLAAKALPNPHGTKFLVNTRVDVALAAGADGVHFPSGSPEPRRWRGIVPDGFAFGVSCHSIEELTQAEQEGATYVVFGPVFSPRSKTSTATPVGLDGLAAATRSVRIPVLALGGLKHASVDACIRAGAAGISGISLFLEPV